MTNEQSFLPLSRPDVTEEEIRAVAATMASGWLTTGPEVARFEEEFCAYVGARAGVALTSATAGLHLALELCGVGPGDEVLVPDWTFVACGHVVEWVGATPVPVDVLEESLDIDPEAIRRAITGRTKAIMPVHFAGHPCDMAAIRSIAAERGLRVIEDAAHAHGAAVDGVRIGGPGTDIACFSFYAIKNLCTGEGGMLVSGDEELVERARRLSYFGVDKQAFTRYEQKGSWYYEVTGPGYKYNFDSMHAAMGRVQLRRLDSMNARRREIAAYYRQELASIDGLVLPGVPDGIEHCWHLFVVRLREAPAGRRDRLLARLKEMGIGCSVHFMPLSHHPYYQERFGWRPENQPVARDAYTRAFSIPLCSAMTDGEAARVVSALRTAIADEALANRRCHDGDRREWTPGGGAPHPGGDSRREARG